MEERLIDDLYVYLFARITCCVLLVQIAGRVELTWVFKLGPLEICGAESHQIESSRRKRLWGMRRETGRNARLWSKTKTITKLCHVSVFVLWGKSNQIKITSLFYFLNCHLYHAELSRWFLSLEACRCMNESLKNRNFWLLFQGLSN